MLSKPTKKPMGIRMQKAIRKDWQLFIMCLLPVIYYIVFHYIPMYGVQIAFKDFYASKGIWGSQWVGMKYFKRFFHSYQFWPLIRNTLSLSFLQIAVGFPAPIILAILLNQMKNQRFKQFVQTVTYCPHFISIVVLTGMLSVFLSPRSGLINNLIAFLGGEPKFFLGEPGWFRPIFVLSGVWQNAGWSAIIYIAALGGSAGISMRRPRWTGRANGRSSVILTFPGLCLR